MSYSCMQVLFPSADGPCSKQGIVFSLIIVRVGLGLSSEKTEARKGRKGHATTINLTSFFAPAPVRSGGTATTTTTTDTDDREHALQTLSPGGKTNEMKDGAISMGVRMDSNVKIEGADVVMGDGIVEMDRIFDGYYRDVEQGRSLESEMSPATTVHGRINHEQFSVSGGSIPTLIASPTLPNSFVFP